MLKLLSVLSQDGAGTYGANAIVKYNYIQQMGDKNSGRIGPEGEQVYVTVGIRVAGGSYCWLSTYYASSAKDASRYLPMRHDHRVIMLYWPVWPDSGATVQPVR